MSKRQSPYDKLFEASRQVQQLLTKRNVHQDYYNYKRTLYSNRGDTSFESLEIMELLSEAIDDANNDLLAAYDTLIKMTEYFNPELEVLIDYETDNYYWIDNELGREFNDILTIKKYYGC